MNLGETEKEVNYEPIELPKPLQQPQVNPEPIHQKPVEVPERV